MEPRGILKAFPKVKRTREVTERQEPLKKLKENQEVQEEWLKPVTAHIIQAGIGRARTEIFQKQIIRNGGQICSPHSSEITHIILDDGMDCDRAFRILKLDKLPPGVQLVKSSWLSLCIRERKLVNTTGYSIFIPDRYLNEVDQMKIDNEHIHSVMNNDTPEPTAESLGRTISMQPRAKLPKQNLVEEPSAIQNISDGEESEDEDNRVTQGDLDALISGHYLTPSIENSSSSSTIPSISGKWVCAQSSDCKKENHNRAVTEKLEVLAKTYTLEGDKWRALGYSKAISALKSHHKPVTSYQEACKIPGIGKRMAEKIEEILESGHLRKLDYISESVPVLEVFSNIWGVGVKTAQMWYQQGFRSLDDIRTKATLTNQQAIGLKYYEDFLDRMPREEAAEIEKTVTEVVHCVNPGLLSIACGSFRRGKVTCGDVDVLVTHPDGKSHRGIFGKVIDGLKRRGFLTDDLVKQEDNGNQKKYMGVCCLPGPDRKHRRLDVIIVPYSEFACALMYFTGSAHFNRSMRAFAKTKSMSLSEHSLNKDVVRNGKLKVSTGFAIPTSSEKDVFKLLGLPYREPQQRDW
ncbi:DNA polymerase lambda [Rhinatrema bivittatum]|uniref:DNA polymerase lambda n=1 Tax=Rhinatrema bivittatum TaxID=194408 RepID=UPI0011287C3E|nr:DNA polymerase lambda [Rhinatrema bivittatum]